MEIIKEIFKLLSNLGVFGLGMWFIQMLLSKSADRKFESYKNELNLQNYKATKVYEQQLTIIIELHKKLTILHRKMVLMPITLMKNITERTDETEKKELESVADASIAYDAFLLFYQDNLIFMTQNIIDKIYTITSEYNQNFASYFTKRGTKDEITFEQALDTAQKLSTDINQALGLLTFEFKKQLGVEK